MSANSKAKQLDGCEDGNDEPYVLLKHKFKVHLIPPSFVNNNRKKKGSFKCEVCDKDVYYKRFFSITSCGEITFNGKGVTYCIHCKTGYRLVL